MINNWLSIATISLPTALPILNSTILFSSKRNRNFWEMYFLKSNAWFLAIQESRSLHITLRFFLLWTSWTTCSYLINENYNNLHIWRMRRMYLYRMIKSKCHCKFIVMQYAVFFTETCLPLSNWVGKLKLEKNGKAWENDEIKNHLLSMAKWVNYKASQKANT